MFCRLTLGVRQKTVRQQSTMDNAGTLPIYVYNNVEEQTYAPVPSEAEALTIVAVDEQQDDIEVVQPEASTTRSGRPSKKKKLTDFIHH